MDGDISIADEDKICYFFYTKTSQICMSVLGETYEIISNTMMK